MPSPKWETPNPFGNCPPFFFAPCNVYLCLMQSPRFFHANSTLFFVIPSHIICFQTKRELTMQRIYFHAKKQCKEIVLMQDIHAHAENMKGEIKVDQEKGPFPRNLQAVGLPVSKRSSFYFFSQCFCLTLLSSLAAFQPGSSPFFSFPFHLLELSRWRHGNSQKRIGWRSFTHASRGPNRCSPSYFRPFLVLSIKRGIRRTTLGLGVPCGNNCSFLGLRAALSTTALSLYSKPCFLHKSRDIVVNKRSLQAFAYRNT